MLKKYPKIILNVESKTFFMINDYSSSTISFLPI